MFTRLYVVKEGKNKGRIQKNMFTRLDGLQHRDHQSCTIKLSLEFLFYHHGDMDYIKHLMLQQPKGSWVLLLFIIVTWIMLGTSCLRSQLSWPLYLKCHELKILLVNFITFSLNNVFPKTEDKDTLPPNFIFCY